MLLPVLPDLISHFPARSASHTSAAPTSTAAAVAYRGGGDGDDIDDSHSAHADEEEEENGDTIRLLVMPVVQIFLAMTMLNNFYDGVENDDSNDGPLAAADAAAAG